MSNPNNGCAGQADDRNGSGYGNGEVSAQADPAPAAEVLPPESALMLAPLRQQDTASRGHEAQPAPAPFGLRRLIATAALAALTGAVAGPLATAGLSTLMGPTAAVQSNDQLFADRLARIDHQVSALKGAIDSSTRTQTAAVAKVADRMERAEKAQNDAGVRLAKAGDVLDRVERRLAATAETTGALGEAHAAATPAPAADPKRPPVVEDWVLRDVRGGAAMIEGRGGVLVVVAGERLPGLGRIETIKRQDGHWVVVTSRGLIMPR